MVSTRVSVLFWAAVLSAAVALYCLSYAPQAKAAYACSGKDVYPSQNLTTVAVNSKAGTTFCLHDGTYHVSTPVRVEGNDRFIGLYNDSSRPAVVTTKAHHVFNTKPSRGARIQGLTISGAVGGNYCEPNCGRGIGGGGKNLTVDNVRTTQNANQGIGGTGGGLLVKNSMIDHNGSYSFSRDGGSVSAAGIKSVNSMSIYNTQIIDNYWAGVWCDIECGAFEVHDSTVSGNGKVGIDDEISSGPALFEGNIIKNNGTRFTKHRHTGLLIVDSKNVNSYSNTFGGNVEYGVEIAKTRRTPGIGNVSIHDNTMKGDPLKGCAISSVSCKNNN